MANIPKPPLGLVPYKFWLEFHPDPTPEQLLERKRELDKAVARYRVDGRMIPSKWTNR